MNKTGNFIDLTNKRFGRLIALKSERKNGRVRWLCRCDCGNIKSIQSTHLRSGASKSCGCLQKEINIANLTQHGQTRSSLHNRWKAIKQRCLNPKNTRYNDYGGRGITLCEEWLDYKTFSKWCYENNYSCDLELDRIDNNKGYNPENCRWTTSSINNRNRRDTVYIDNLSLKEFSEIHDIKLSTIKSRYYNMKKANKSITTKTILKYANQLPTQ